MRADKRFRGYGASGGVCRLSPDATLGPDNPASRHNRHGLAADPSSEPARAKCVRGGADTHSGSMLQGGWHGHV